jgi:molybdopterin converting factor small subunit
MPSTAAPTLTLRVLLFGSYAERLGFESLDLSLEGGATIEDVLSRLRSLPGGEALPAQPLCALNLRQVKAHAPLSSGDELAILPPLAGG